MTELLIEVTRDRRTSSVTGGDSSEEFIVESGVCDCAVALSLRSLRTRSFPRSLPSSFPPTLSSSSPPRSLRALSAGRRLRVASIAALSEGVASATCIERWAWRRTLRVTLHSLFTHSSLTLACSTRCVACSPLSPAERLQASTLRSWKETKPVTSAVSSWRSISVQPSMQTRTFRSCCIALTLSARTASSSGGSCKGSGLK